MRFQTAASVLSLLFTAFSLCCATPASYRLLLGGEQSAPALTDRYILPSGEELSCRSHFNRMSCCLSLAEGAKPETQPQLELLAPSGERLLFDKEFSSDGAQKRCYWTDHNSYFYFQRMGEWPLGGKIRITFGSYQEELEYRIGN
jgi:hypothetical protein